MALGRRQPAGRLCVVRVVSAACRACVSLPHIPVVDMYHTSCGQMSTPPRTPPRFSFLLRAVVVLLDDVSLRWMPLLPAVAGFTALRRRVREKGRDGKGKGCACAALIFAGGD